MPSKDSAKMIADFAALKAEREAADAKIEAWAARVDEPWLGPPIKSGSQARPGASRA